MKRFRRLKWRGHADISKILKRFMKRFLFLLLVPSLAWGQAFTSGYKPAFGPFISPASQPGLRILEESRDGKGIVDLSYDWDGRGTAGTGTALLNLRGDTFSGHKGNVTGAKIRLNHHGDADLDPGFTIGMAVGNNASKLVPPDGTSPSITGFFGNVGTPRVGRFNAAALELNIANHWQDVGPRLPGVDFDITRVKNPMRIMALKPEDGYWNDLPGYSLDAFMVIGPDNRSDRLVGAYSGLLAKNDAIAAGGVGIRLGGRTDSFPDAPPESAIRVDHTWQRGIDFTNAELNDVAVDLMEGQRVRWNTSGGPITFTAWKGKAFIYGPQGLKQIYP